MKKTITFLLITGGLCSLLTTPSSFSSSEGNDETEFKIVFSTALGSLAWAVTRITGKFPINIPHNTKATFPLGTEVYCLFPNKAIYSPLTGTAIIFNPAAEIAGAGAMSLAAFGCVELADATRKTCDKCYNKVNEKISSWWKTFKSKLTT